jgi:hypothetical protein
MPDIIKNDTDVGVVLAVGSNSTAWNPYPEPNAWNGDTAYAQDTGGNNTATATYSFTGLTNGTTYTLLAFWYAFSNRTAAAQYTVKGSAGATLATFSVNQRVTPTGPPTLFDNLSVAWPVLTVGTFIADGTTGSVVGSVLPGDNGVLMADMVALRSAAVTARRGLKWFKRRRSDGSLATD